MKEILINRDKITNNYALGHCYGKDDGELHYLGTSLERGWLNNQKNISCIPEGTYKLRLEYSNNFKTRLWEIYGVPNRSECKFHAANFWKQLNGCISLGEKRVDINKDGDLDVTNSKKSIMSLHKFLKGDVEARLIIKNL